MPFNRNFSRTLQGGIRLLHPRSLKRIWSVRRHLEQVRVYDLLVLSLLEGGGNQGLFSTSGDLYDFEKTYLKGGKGFFLRCALRLSRRKTAALLCSDAFHNQAPSEEDFIEFTRVLEQQGLVFIKLGQFLSTRADLIGPRLAKALTRLQESSQATEWSQLKAGLGCSQHYWNQFEWIDPTPLSVGSIAQIHRATLASLESTQASSETNREVVLKIVKLGVYQEIQDDLNLLQSLVDALVPEPLRSFFKLDDVLRLLKKQLLEECDLRLEAGYIQRFQRELSQLVHRSLFHSSTLTDLLQFQRRIRVPQVFWGVSSSRILVLEYIESAPLTDAPEVFKLKHAEGLKDLSQGELEPIQKEVDRLLEDSQRAFFAQTYLWGFFHADQHPGNLRLTPEGDLVFLDFGAVGLLSFEQNWMLASLFKAVFEEDFLQVALVLTHAESLAFVGKSYSVLSVESQQVLSRFAARLEGLCLPFLYHVPYQEKRLSFAELLGQLFLVGTQFGLDFDPNLLLLQKTLVVAEGAMLELSPQFDPWNISYTLIDLWAKDQVPSALMKQYWGQKQEKLSQLSDTLYESAQLFNARMERKIKK